MNPKVLVYQQRAKLAPTGGPSAIGYYYATEQDRRGDHNFEYLSTAVSYSELHSQEAKTLNRLPSFLQKFYSFIKQIVRYNIMLGGKYRLDHIDFTKYDIIHFHDTQGLYLRRFELKDYKGKVLLQSHSPQPLGVEMYNAIPPIVRFFIPFIKKRFEEMDKYAFERADYILFPCMDAEEPYYNEWKNYKNIHNKKAKAYRYLLTGIPECTPKRTRDEVYAELGLVDGSFMISYVGRHNEVKGYDMLKKIGKQYLERNSSSYIVCAGREEPLKRLSHSHWLEIGWTTDAHSYISASDVFILPNKETYFDIVMLEVLSLGKIVIASRTGGNKFFEKKGCEGVLLYDTIEEAVVLLEQVNSMSKNERKELGYKNREFYRKNHTVGTMYESYVSLLEELSKMK